MGISSVGDLKQQVAHVDSSKEQSKLANEATSVKDESLKSSQLAEQAKPGKEQLDDSVTKMNDYVQNIERNLSFSVDEATGHDVVRVVDTSTNELIRQFPTEDFLKMSKNLSEVSGLLFNDIV